MMNLFSKAKDLFDGGKKEEDLIDHVCRGDVDFIKTVDQKVLLKARGYNRSTCLMIATHRGNFDLCKEILKKCPSLLYHKNGNRETFLHEVSNLFYGAENFLFFDLFVSVCVDELAKSRDTYLKFKRWMKMKNDGGDTALVIAARDGNLHVVKRFVEVDRQYNLGLSKVVGSEGRTALDCAVEKQDHEMVKLLEGDPNSDFVPYSTAVDLFYHVRNGDLDYIQTVELNVLLNSRDKCRRSALCIGTQCDQLDCCEEILKRCPSLLYHKNIFKESVLHVAAKHRNYRWIDFFVSFGLEAAKCEGGTENMIRFEKWINLIDSFGHTALMVAVIQRNHDIVKRFVEVDHQYKLGLSTIRGKGKTTALQFAMSCKYHEIIKLLNASNLQDQESLQPGNSSCTGDKTVVSETNIFTSAEVSNHNDLKDSWPLINNKVNDVTIFLGDHPSGSEVLLKATVDALAGKDAITDSKKVQSHSGNVVTMMDKFYVGACDSIITSSLNKLSSDKPQPYSWMQLKEFTKDFSQRLGSGGFGDVYKGQFSNSVFIAVKVLKNIEFMEKVMQEQFVAEIDTMGRAYHHNLIKLHGYCYEANTKFKALVYDYMENGSFDKILFEKKLDIPWTKLQNIAKEIAQGVSYLHEGCNPRIIHYDIKPANVLLDSNLSPKVIDFGLAHVTNMGESQFEQTKIKGSRGYMAPEVNQLTRVKQSCKLDVYSFGMMLFDILGSKRNYVDKKWFPGQVWDMYRAGKLEKFSLDCGIKEEDKKNAENFAIIALLCVEHDPRNRPMLSNVVKMLEGIIKLDTPVTPFYPGYCSSENSSMSDSRDL